jgi:hypothetical protein
MKYHLGTPRWKLQGAVNLVAAHALQLLIAGLLLDSVTGQLLHTFPFTIQLGLAG